MKPLLQRIEAGEIDPSYIVTHTLKPTDAPVGYDLFRKKQDGCLKVILRP